MTTLYLEDLQVGQKLRSRSEVVDLGDMKAFAAEFDPQPFHLDEEAAKSSLFGGIAASGWHTAAMTMRLIVDSTPLAGGVIGAGVELNWPRPVRAGDVLTVVSEIMDIQPSRSKPDRGIVVVRSETVDQRGEAVQIMTAKLVVFRRPG